MMKAIHFSVLLLSVITTNAYRARFNHPMENPDLYQGDIAGKVDMKDKNAVPHDIQRWPNGEIPYKIDSSVKNIKKVITDAIKYIEASTCLDFIPYDGSQKNYINIFAGDGCYSYWGCTGGEQPVSLGDGCDPLGTVIHELVHAIGFDHEQNRSDRDDYLIIYWDNIEEDNYDQFDKHLPHENRLFTPFDYNSIMLYGETSFSKDGYSRTMVAKKRGVRLVEVYDKYRMSSSDIKRIKLLYKCK